VDAVVDLWRRASGAGRSWVRERPSLSSHFIQWGSGRPTFGGRGAACGGDSSMVSPLPSCGGFGVGETEGMGGDVVDVRY
jgi:hypothetical protein